MPPSTRTRLVFLDETWAKTNMTRTHGYAPRGERLVEAVPHGHWKTTTFVAALRADGLIAPMVLDGAMNGEVFVAYVEQVLVPALRPGDVVVMDNLASHKAAGVRGRSRRPGAGCCTCRRTARTSTRSRTPIRKLKGLLRTAAGIVNASEDNRRRGSM